ncbi:MAG: iron permease, partial [Chloroflexi bacterium]|nr:iron permease [Chloroflexota bacterium]
MRSRQASIHVLWRWAGLALAAVWLFTAASPVRAQAGEPWQAADAVRQALFTAQTALLAGSGAQAVQSVAEAVDLYAGGLAPAFEQAAPEAGAAVQAALTQAQGAAREGDAGQLALARGRVWTAMLQGSFRLAVQAAQDGRVADARAWLQLRDFRTATRLTRPGAGATLSLDALDKQQLSPQDAGEAVRVDLLDAYQVQLDSALAAVKDASQRDLPLRAAESAGLAEGYWELLAPSYEEQRGAEARAGLDAAFDGLAVSASAADPGDAASLVAEIEAGLSGFRAAPLSPEEQSRRAGQLLRFLALVPVEYGRGVKDGQVFMDLEVQEAVTFMGGARTAYADLHPALSERDAARAGAVAADLAALEEALLAAGRHEQVAGVDQVAGQTAAIQSELETLLPAEWQAVDSDADFDVLISMLDQIEKAVAQGEYALAESTRLEAYAVYDVGMEPRLQAFAPALVAEAEGLFWQGTGAQEGMAQAIARQASPEEVRGIRAALQDTLSEARLVLGDVPSSPLAMTGNAAVIVFREGLEAVVILAALMASMVGAYARYRKPMAWGVVLAMLASVLTWLLAQEVLTSLAGYGERLEAIVSLIAIGVLLLVTNWFFHKTYWKDWLAGFHQQKRRLISREAGQIFGLVMLGFTSVYREGFETVLFLQALVLDAGALVVLEGVAIGLVAVLLVGWVTFRLNVHLPYKRMLVFTGVLIGAVLVTMVGNTVHIFQAVGWLPVTPIVGVTPPYWMGVWFGVFPTWQGVIAQVAAAAFVIGS